MRPRKVSAILRDSNVVQLARTDSVREAARQMKAHGCGSVLVTEGTRLLGIFTERDLVNKIVADGRDPDATTAGEVMTANPKTVESDEAAIVALRMMDDGGFRHLPVVDDGRVVGVLSRRDFPIDVAAQIENERRIWDKV